jgi:uncharacterized membrane protein YkvA (DUF1232 family)
MNKNNILNQILESGFFSKSYKSASKMTGNSVGILQLLKNVLSKVKDLGTSGVLNEIKNKVITLANLLKAYASGQYREVSPKNLIIIIAAFLYFLSPFDLIPDFLPIIGFADDIALLTFVYTSISAELEKFELWEINQGLNN